MLTEIDSDRGGESRKKIWFSGYKVQIK